MANEIEFGLSDIGEDGEHNDVGFEGISESFAMQNGSFTKTVPFDN